MPNTQNILLRNAFSYLEQAFEKHLVTTMALETKRILIIEDERSIAQVMSLALSEDGWSVEWEGDGERGLDTALAEEFAAVIIDVMLPSRSGWEILQVLRAKNPTVPILMTTALDGVDDKVRGLHLGADDYLVKPFELSELLARVESVVRRGIRASGLVTEVADLVVNRKTRTVTRAGRSITLTRREYDLLEALASNVGSVLDRDTLQRRVWTDNEAFGKSVDVFARTLKDKIDFTGPELIHGCEDGYSLSEASLGSLVTCP